LVLLILHYLSLFFSITFPSFIPSSNSRFDKQLLAVTSRDGRSVNEDRLSSVLDRG